MERDEVRTDTHFIRALGVSELSSLFPNLSLFTLKLNQKSALETIWEFDSKFTWEKHQFQIDSVGGRVVVIHKLWVGWRRTWWGDLVNFAPFTPCSPSTPVRSQSSLLDQAARKSSGVQPKALWLSILVGWLSFSIFTTLGREKVFLCSEEERWSSSLPLKKHKTWGTLPLWASSVQLVTVFRFEPLHTAKITGYGAGSSSL